MVAPSDPAIPKSPWQPLGDQAVLASFADERTAFAFSERVRHLALEEIVDVVQAYTTVAVYFDLSRTNYATMLERLQALPADPEATQELRRLRRVPCCYEKEQDLETVAKFCRLTREEVIAQHLSTTYTVYAIGFCPGFPYLGYLPPSLTGAPRLATPRARVEAGSVGLTNRQTGIYTLPRPGGWNIIGRTPLVLVDVADGYFPLRTGDRVEFIRIDEAEFGRLQGQRL